MGRESKICPSCKEKNNPTFNVCWKCKTPFRLGNVIESEKVDTIVSVILQSSFLLVMELLKEEEFKKQKLEIVNKISIEATIFFLQLCDREIFRCVGFLKRNAMMDMVFKKIYKKLEDHDNKVLKELYGERSSKNLKEYFDYLARSAVSTGIRETYTERLAEYEAYQKLLPEKEEPPKGTLVWEFSKKISWLTADPPLPTVIMLVNLLVSNMLEPIMESFKAILETE